MKQVFSILALPACLMALSVKAVPSPKDFQDRNLALIDGAVISDSTWVVSDSDYSLWFSRDSGETWESVPADSSDLDGEIYGSTVVGSDLASIWTFRSGWVPMKLPASFQSTDESYFGAMGDRGFLDPTTGKLHFYRSFDGMKTWIDWLTMDTSVVPANSSRWGDMELGRIWYLVSDSGYVRGTSNGTTWIRATLPTDFEPAMIDPDNIDTTLQLLGYLDSNLVLARSSDLGKSWSTPLMTDPGTYVLKLDKNLWSSSTSNELNSAGELWFSRSPTGPWSMVPVSGINGFFSWRGTPYLTTDSGLFQVDPTYSSVVPRIGRERLSFHREADRIVVEIPSKYEGSAWTLAAANGTVLQGGIAPPGRLAISCPRSVGWLRIGRAVVATPPR